MPNIQKFKDKFRKRCLVWNVPIPIIEESCDFKNHTDEDEILVHLDPEASVDAQVGHLFGHYLADLHTNPKMSDKVADAIMNMSTIEE